MIPLYILNSLIFVSFKDKGTTEDKTQKELSDISSPKISGKFPFFPL